MKKLLKVGKEVHENYINGLFFKKKNDLRQMGHFRPKIVTHFNSGSTIIVQELIPKT